jgi:hypothetical protein
MSVSWDELERRAQGTASGVAVPDEWGSPIVLEVGELFRCRFRGFGEGGQSGAYLFWDMSGELRFIWSNASLRREIDREKPTIGDDVVLARSENYRTQYQGPDEEPAGYSFGVATRRNDSPVPATPAEPDVEPAPEVDEYELF